MPLGKHLLPVPRQPWGEDRKMLGDVGSDTEKDL